MLWVGEVDDAKSIDERIASASTAGDPIRDLRESWFQDCMRGLRKILTGNFKKQVTTAEGKAQSDL